MSEDVFQNKYSLVKGAARRARQLYSGMPAMGVSASLKVCRVAQEEILQGKVTYVVTEKTTLPPPGSL